MKHKGKIVLPRKIVTFNSTKTVKESAKIKASSLYVEISDLNLIVKDSSTIKFVTKILPEIPFK